MEENNEYTTQSNNQSNSPGYYELYTEQKVKEARGVFSRYGLGLFAYLLVSYAASFVLQFVLLLAVGPDKYYDLIENNVYVQWIFSVLSMYLISFPIFFLITKGMKKRQYEKSNLKASDFSMYFIISWGLMIAGNIIGNVLNGIISAIMKRDISNSTSDLIEKSPIWLIILVVVIIGPIIEEVLFRKMMIDRLGRYGDKVAIIVSSVAFGLFHGNFYQFFYAAFIGLVLGYMYTKTGKTLYNTLMHMAINFFGSVISIFMIDKAERLDEMLIALENGETVNFAEFIKNYSVVGSYSVIQYGIGIAGIAVLIYYFSGRVIKVNKYAEYALPREKTVSTVLLNVGAILFTVWSLVTFVLNIILV